MVRSREQSEREGEASAKKSKRAKGALQRDSGSCAPTTDANRGANNLLLLRSPPLPTNLTLLSRSLRARARFAHADFIPPDALKRLKQQGVGGTRRRRKSLRVGDRKGLFLGIVGTMRTMKESKEARVQAAEQVPR
jgi:hypothetical protein